MNLKLKKVYSVSKKGKPEKPRLFLQHLVCEAAGFTPKGELFISINGVPPTFRKFCTLSKIRHKKSQIPVR